MKKVSKKVDILIKPQHLDGAYQKRFSFSQRSILRILILLIIITTFLIIFLVSFIIKESFHSKSSWGPKLKNSNGNRDPRIPQYLETPYHPILLNSSFDQIKLPRGTISCTHDSSCRKWMDIYVKKLLCLYRSCGTVFIYHIRKAAGTTIRQVLQYYGAANKWSLLESEGKVLDHRFLDQPGITALISIRDPIDRIISLYWYEHVQYYCKVMTNETKASSLQAWVNHWRDSSKWKKNFTHYYPGSIYVEVENYYVKALTQWDGKHTLTRVDLEKAKSILQKFDLVMISEWLNITSRKYTLDAFVTGTSTMPLTHSFVLLSRNKTLIQRLQNVLAPDELEIRRQLTKINQYDIELYEYTKSVYNQRFPVLKSLAEQFKKAPAPIWKLTKLRQTHILDAKRCRIQSVCPIPNVTDSMLNTTGFFRSPGYKLPINATWLDKEGSKL